MSSLTPLPAEATDGLALALIGSSNTPLLLMSADMDVVAASRSFCREFRIEEASARGKPLFSLGDGEWDVPQLRTLLKSTLAGDFNVPIYEMDLVRAGQPVLRLAINVRKLDFADAGASRLMVTVSDMTAARDTEQRYADTLREKDDRLRDDAILLKQLGGRVANSLQIIASVLLQSAQRVASDETRGHLYDAHHRVLSVAAVQKQLSVTQTGEVHLDTYLNDLCDSLGASMIRDANQVSLTVKIDNGVTTPEGSVSLGLIVTELVINALKHAFPDHRKGKILVSYHRKGDAWTLAVADDGVGLPDGEDFAQNGGLGSSLVAALANQLEARVEATNANPGTLISIVHP
jgi:two-component system, sensor histidine kinase PdtaS